MPSSKREGSIRPHFFRGVATIVTKLFNATSPNVVFFGQKDIQQCVVIRTMIKDLLMPIRMVIVPTMREPDGLAMSSRNRYLSPSERASAPILYQGLLSGQKMVQSGIYSRKEIIDQASSLIQKDPSVQLEYLSIADPTNLHEIDSVAQGAIFSGAIRVGKTRIIDNLLLGLTVDDLK